MEGHEIAGLIILCTALFVAVMWVKGTKQKITCPMYTCKYNEDGTCFKSGLIDLRSVEGHTGELLRCRRYTVKRIDVRR